MARSPYVERSLELHGFFEVVLTERRQGPSEEYEGTPQAPQENEASELRAVGFGGSE